MAIEIERRYLVVNDSWRRYAVAAQRLRDGVLAVADGRKVRVRLYADRATLAVKTRQTGGVREEYEYDIPRDDAERLIACHCGDYVLEKTRHYAPYAGLTWEIDVYDGLLAGVVIAEVELDRADAPFAPPPWIGREVTGNPFYRTRTMLERRLRTKIVAQERAPAELAPL